MLVGGTGFATAYPVRSHEIAPLCKAAFSKLLDGQSKVVVAVGPEALKRAFLRRGHRASDSLGKEKFSQLMGMCGLRSRPQAINCGYTAC